MKLFDPIELLIYKFSFRHCGGPKMASPQSHRIFNFASTVFYCEHSQGFADTNDKCEHG